MNISVEQKQEEKESQGTKCNYIYNYTSVYEEGKYGLFSDETCELNVNIEQSTTYETRFKITVSCVGSEDKNGTPVIGTCVIDIVKYEIFIPWSLDFGCYLIPIALKQFKQDYIFVETSLGLRERSMYVKSGNKITYYDADVSECYGTEREQLCTMGDIPHDPNMYEVGIHRTLKIPKLEEKPRYYSQPSKYELKNREKHNE